MKKVTKRPKVNVQRKQPESSTQQAVKDVVKEQLKAVAGGCMAHCRHC
ncbi:MAG TPA: hypothetical protein VGF94_05065 [Kofleriaceae bacterium]|jgi:hypothetical protein